MSGSLLRLDNLPLPLEEDSPESLRRAVAGRLGVPEGALGEVEVLKRSLDCRQSPRVVYSLYAAPGPGLRLEGALPQGVRWEEPAEAFAAPLVPEGRRGERVAVIGAGPAGLFAALHLAQGGLRPILLEQGKPVETRAQDVSRLMHWGQLQERSNLCFGEGGAGTWSDGKLTTRIGAPQVRHVLEALVQMGAPERILTDGKPHLGTDRLIAMLKRLRAQLEAAGAEIRFGCEVTKLDVDERRRRLRGLVLADGERVEAARVVLATGHSSRRLYATLLEAGVLLEPKAFAVGFRVEHPQRTINELQYGRWVDHPGLPAADYRITANLRLHGVERGVYSFCMCPGGQVVPTPTEPGGVVVNGMSHAARSGAFANSALVVTVNPSDFGGDHPLSGVDFQRRAEEAAGALGGGLFRAPAQSVTGFLQKKVDREIRKTSYTPGVTPGDLWRCYPGFVGEALAQALVKWQRQMPAFVTQEAVLIGVETRTSAPVSVTRGEDYQSKTLAGLYPCGEGSGYGGGIVSAAVDGLRVAQAILLELRGA